MDVLSIIHIVLAGGFTRCGGPQRPHKSGTSIGMAKMAEVPGQRCVVQFPSPRAEALLCPRVFSEGRAVHRARKHAPLRVSTPGQALVTEGRGLVEGPASISQAGDSKGSHLVLFSEGPVASSGSWEGALTLTSPSPSHVLTPRPCF